LSFVNCWGIFSSAFKQIDAGTVVTTLYGNVQTGILRSGLNVINPLDVVDFDIRTQNYTMSRKMKEISLVMMRFEYCQMTDLK
jgi:hypothetical protein